jgi:hypothetical protein
MTARALPILRFSGRRWFFDERLAEVRDTECPWNRVQLSRDLVTALKLFGEFEADGTAHEDAVQEKRPAMDRGR